jgi:hypothetical protein
MAALDDGTPPFFALAADRAGLRRGQVKEWIHQADHGSNPHPLIIEFGRRAREIKAKYVLGKMGEMISCDAKTAARASQLQWMITRLEREELHINPNPGKEVTKAEPEQQAAPSREAPRFDAEDTLNAVGDLANPETVN